MTPLAPSEPDAPWGAWRWIGFILLTLVSVASAVIVAVFIVFGYSTSCSDPATSANRDRGLWAFLVEGLVYAALWGVGAVIGRRTWGRFAIGGVVTLLPVILIALQHRHTSDWVGNGFCF